MDQRRRELIDQEGFMGNLTYESEQAEFKRKQEIIAEEREACFLLRQSHPDYRKKTYSLQQCLDCPEIPSEIKQSFVEKYKAAYGTELTWKA